MTITAAFYHDRANEARRDADNASLANVRERCLRAAAAWQVMADRAARANRHRVEDEARKAEVARLEMPGQSAV